MYCGSNNNWKSKYIMYHSVFFFNTNTRKSKIAIGNVKFLIRKINYVYISINIFSTLF